MGDLLGRPYRYIDTIDLEKISMIDTIVKAYSTLSC